MVILGSWHATVVTRSSSCVLSQVYIASHCYSAALQISVLCKGISRVVRLLLPVGYIKKWYGMSSSALFSSVLVYTRQLFTGWKKKQRANILAQRLLVPSHWVCVSHFVFCGWWFHKLLMHCFECKQSRNLDAGSWLGNFWLSGEK